MENKICCLEHPEAILIEDYRAGDQICSECGLVVGDRFVYWARNDQINLVFHFSVNHCILYDAKAVASKTL